VNSVKATLNQLMPIIKRCIPNAAKTIMIFSGKGGVGKSTVSASVAVGLARNGMNVGLLDLDVYGPSIPRLMGFRESASLANADDDDGSSSSLTPLINYGVQCMSMGFLTPPDGFVAWRGLMVMKGVQQLLWNVKWKNKLDILVLDMPPGTGDTHLTVCQQVIVDGAVIVTTPQKVALSGAEKGVRFLKTMNVPVIGVVENMRWVECNQCHSKVQLFNEFTNDFAHKYNLPILGSVPMLSANSNSIDDGVPITSGNTIPNYYSEIIGKIANQLNSATTIQE
jgi:ATP-binding protein involved in chromosome partitioning